MITISVDQMQGWSCGLNCLNIKDDKKTIGFVIPVPYHLTGYWGGMCYIVFSFNALNKGIKCEKMVITIQDICDHLEITTSEFINALTKADIWHNWESINTMFYKP